MNEPKEIFVRIDRCMGCHSCEMACAVAHSEAGTLYGALSETPRPRRRLYVEPVQPDGRVPVVCRHCEDAPCIHACISGAIHRSEDGTVVSATEKCIGCWTCIMVCPYGVIGRHLETKTAVRCDRCVDRDLPACVGACPTHALVYETATRFAADTRGRASAELATAAREGARP